MRNILDTHTVLPIIGLTALLALSPMRSRLAAQQVDPSARLACVTQVRVGWDLTEDGTVVRAGQVSNTTAEFLVEFVGLQPPGPTGIVFLPHLRSSVFGSTPLFLQTEEMTGELRPRPEPALDIGLETIAVEHIVVPELLFLGTFVSGRQRFTLGAGFSREGTVPFLWLDDRISSQYLSRGMCVRV